MRVFYALMNISKYQEELTNLYHYVHIMLRNQIYVYQLVIQLFNSDSKSINNS